MLPPAGCLALGGIHETSMFVPHRHSCVMCGFSWSWCAGNVKRRFSRTARLPLTCLLGSLCTQVLVRWACDKISAAAATQPDDQLMDALQVGGLTAGLLVSNRLVSTHGSRHLHVVWLVRQRWVPSLLTATPATGPPQAKLAGQAGVKYAAVASHAAAEGRRGLAALLLEHERVAAEQVPLLLDLGRHRGLAGA